MNRQLYDAIIRQLEHLPPTSGIMRSVVANDLAQLAQTLDEARIQIFLTTSTPIFVGSGSYAALLEELKIARADLTDNIDTLSNLIPVLQEHAP